MLILCFYVENQDAGEDDEDYEDEEVSRSKGKKSRGKKGGAVPLKKRRVGGGKRPVGSDSDEEEGELQVSACG